MTPETSFCWASCRDEEILLRVRLQRWALGRWFGQRCWAEAEQTSGNVQLSCARGMK